MCGSNFWLEGKHVAPGVEVLSGPINFHDLPYNLVPAYSEIGFIPSVNTECHPSRPLDHDLPDNDRDTFLSDSLPTLLLLETDTAHPTPNDFKVECYSTVAVKSTRNNITPPSNAHLGELHITTPHDQHEFKKAGNDTAKQLADSWLAFVETPQPILPSAYAASSVPHPLINLNNRNVLNRKMN